jgi:hypothetical protein
MIAAAGLGLALPGGDAAAQAVYRCDDGKGGTLYADTPCRGGTKVDILPGKADPAAIERLRREQRAFDERQAAREARAREEALAERESRLALRERELDADAAWRAGRLAAEPVYTWGGWWPWYPGPPVGGPPPTPPRPPRPDASPAAPHVPAAPGRFGVPSPPPAMPAPPPTVPRPPIPPPGKPQGSAP